MEEETVTCDEMVERYVKLRDKKTELKAAYERKVAAIDEALKRCENYLLNVLNAQGGESMRTAKGTFYKSQRISVTVADWDSFLAWVQANEMWSLLERRAAKTGVEEYRTVHNDLPPGLDRRAEYIVNVRRS